MSLVVFLSLLALTSGGWIDPDTPKSKLRAKSYMDHEMYDLVMSDEFDREGRLFKDGFDPIWTALEKSDDDYTSSGRKSLHFYNNTHAYTKNGYLTILTTDEDTHWRGWHPYEKKYVKLKRHFRSGMMQSWNKFCFTGGIFEVSLRFPGRPDVGGLWPAVWLLGNLGRATYEASTNLLWPWSYGKCDRNLQAAQEVSGCGITEHYDMHAREGRGATEIDVIEVMPGEPGKLPIAKKHIERPYASMTLQIAPGIPIKDKRPFPGTLPEWGFNWYENLTYGTNVSINPFFYGTYLGPTKKLEPVSRSLKESYQADAISSMGNLNASHWKQMHTFRLEWETGPKGYLRWYMGNELLFGIDQSSLSKTGGQIPVEPSYIILNTAISTSWGFSDPPPGCTEYDCKTSTGRCGMSPGFCQSLPAEMHIDHVRVYQKKNHSSHYVGCNPQKYPTKKFIDAHEYRYKRQIDKHALKPIIKGGGHCSKSSHCGEGKCGALSRCVCNHGWVGPHCLVPAHKDDTPDWNVDEGWKQPATPVVPSFLLFVGFLFVGALSAAVLSVVIRKRNEAYRMFRGEEDDTASWL